MAKSFYDILETYLEQEADTSPNVGSVYSSESQFFFNILNSGLKTAAKNIKVSFAGTEYKVLQEEQREKQRKNIEFLYNKILSEAPSSEVKLALSFFFERGATQFLTKRQESLKKDFRILARKIHPDFYQNTTFQSEKEVEFKDLKRNYEVLKAYFLTFSLGK